MSDEARHWLEQIRALAPSEPVRILNVCGGHERAITRAGLRSVLPSCIELIPGPGCPVCVCPEEDIHAAIRLALEQPVTLVSFGDMLRVPVNVPKGEARSLEQARALGADVRPIASPQEAVRIAQAQPDRPVVFFVVGFETTLAPVAAMVAAGIPDNLLLLCAGRLTWPAVAMLLEDDGPGFDALVAPGHVATVMGPEEWAFVAEDHNIPVAVAGFTTESLLAAFLAVLLQRREGSARVENCYPAVVREGGNPLARRLLQQVFDVSDANWRGIGCIPVSGLALSAAYVQHDVRRHFPVDVEQQRQRAGEMPPGCDCAGVVLGRVRPADCRLYGSACTPVEPVGPCMVSDEGACRIWWQGGVRGESHVTTGC